jgi:hypothetical protein
MVKDIKEKKLLVTRPTTGKINGIEVNEACHPGGAFDS